MAEKIRARIGRGTAYFVAGGCLVVLSILLAMVGAQTPSDYLLWPAAGFVAVGFWTRLFGLLEDRLIDIQVALINGLARRVDRPE